MAASHSNPLLLSAVQIPNKGQRATQGASHKHIWESSQSTNILAKHQCAAFFSAWLYCVRTFSCLAVLQLGEGQCEETWPKYSKLIHCLKPNDEHDNGYRIMGESSWWALRNAGFSAGGCLLCHFILLVVQVGWQLMALKKYKLFFLCQTCSTPYCTGSFSCAIIHFSFIYYFFPLISHCQWSCSF